MLKTKLAIAVSISILTASAFSADGTINFTGTIVSNTCSITTGGGNVTVALPTLSATHFTAVGSRAGQTAFNIDLANCTPANGNVAVRFTGTATQIDPTKGIFLPSTSSTEKGVAIAVYDKTDTQIKPAGNASAFSPIDTATGSASIPLTAWYQQYQPTVTPGSLAASGDIELVYQ